MRATQTAPARRIAVFLCVGFAAFLAGHAEQWPLRVYTRAEGLWSSAINNIARDSHGFVWLCTRDGLSRFDGYRFVNYTIDRAASPAINYLLETGGNTYWVAIQGGGVFRFAAASAGLASSDIRGTNGGEAGRLTLHAEFVLPDGFSVLFEQTNGDLWGGNETGLFRIEEHAGRVTARRVSLGLPQDQPHAVTAIGEAADGSLWILMTRGGLLRRLPDGRVTRYWFDPALPGGSASTLLLDKNGRVWIGASNALVVFNPEPISSVEASAGGRIQTVYARDVMVRIVEPSSGSDPPNRLPEFGNEAMDFTAAALNRKVRPPELADADGVVQGLVQTGDGRVWISIMGGLTVFDGQHFQHYDSPAKTRLALGSLIEDSDGNLWSGTLGGVVRVSVHGLTTFDRSDGLVNSLILSFYEDDRGSLHVVNGFYVSRLDGGRFTTVRPNIPINAVPIWTSIAVFRERSGDWWVLDAERLYHFSGNTTLEDLAHQQPAKVYTTGDLGADGQFYGMFEDSQGGLWLSTRALSWLPGSSGSLFRRQRSSETFQALSEADGLPRGLSAAAFTEDRAGNLWFGFYEGGVARFTRERFHLLSEGVPEGFVTDLHVDRNGRLWLTSSSGGVGRVEDPTAHRIEFSRITTAEGLSSNNARCLTEDSEGNIYVGTVSGVDRLDPDTGRITHYTVADGLAADFVTRAYRDRNGALWFGTHNGLSRFVPPPARPSAPPPIVISDLAIAGVTRPISAVGVQEVDLDPLDTRQNNLQIGFLSLNLARASLVRYQHKLEGAVSGWSSPTEQRTISFANLPAGSYRFLVRAISPEGIVSTRPAVVSFSILPPLWQRGWVMTMAAILLAGVIYAVYRYRLDHLLELERVRAHIATDLHDDIGSSLSRMAILCEVLKRHPAAATDGFGRRLNEMAESARALVDTMGDVVWSVDPTRDDLKNVMMRLGRFASDLFDSKGIRWELQSPTDLPQTILRPEQRRQLFLLLKEAIHNIAKHAHCRTASLNVLVLDHHLSVTLMDDGCGFMPQGDVTPNPNSNGYGLTTMKTRASKLGASLEISSSPREGTVLRLHVPLKTPRWYGIGSRSTQIGS